MKNNKTTEKVHSKQTNKQKNVLTYMNFESQYITVRMYVLFIAGPNRMTG